MCICEELLGLIEPVPLVAEHSPEVSVAGDGIDLLRQLIEELGDFCQPGVNLVGRFTLRTKGVESTLHRYLPGYESSSRPRPDPPELA
jgi:hypothetical protein